MSEYPMNKRVGRNISIPYFLNLWLETRYNGKRCSKYITDLLIKDMEDKDIEFYEKYNNEIDNLYKK